MAVAPFSDNSLLPSAYPRPYCGRNERISRHRHTNTIARSQVRVEDVVEVVHNKVLMAAAVSGAIGQLLKPFTRVFLNGNKKEKEETGFDLRAAIESGGFPSSHSSVVTATATALLLERGFGDSIFGLSVIYAGIVMYDAQGVRREVGKHARVLNKKSLEARRNPSRSSPVKNPEKNRALVMGPDGSAASERQARTVSVSRVDGNRVAKEEEEEETMKEGVGHTKLEVVGGALLGISVSLLINNFI